MTDRETWFGAVSNGDIEAVREMLNGGVDINLTDEKKNTALHLSTKALNFDLMRLLISQGADVNAQNDFLSTPLHLTAKNVEAIRMLLEAGADPNITDKEYCTPYYFAFYGSMTRELTELYIRHGAPLQIFPD